MFLGVVIVFYLNQQEIQTAFRERRSPVSDSGIAGSDVVPVPTRIECLSCAMPREIRDLTVPTGTSRISAIS